MFQALARWVVERRSLVIAFFLLLTPIAIVLGYPVFGLLKPGGFEDRSSQSWDATVKLHDELGVGNADMLVIFTVKSGTADDVEAINAILPVLDEVAQDQGVEHITSYYTTNIDTLLSKDKRRAVAIVTLRGDDFQKNSTYARVRPMLQKTPNVEVQMGGYTSINVTITETVRADLTRAELIALPFTGALLIWIFGSPVAASLPLVLGGLAIALTFALLRVLLLFVDVNVFAANIITLVGLGLSVDYSLFILNRFREERLHLPIHEAAMRAVRTTGRAVAFSGVTVAASMCGLFFFPQMFLKSLAIGGIAVTVLAMILAVTFLPALMVALGPWMDKWQLRSQREKDALSEAERIAQEEKSFWHRLAFGVMKAPVAIAIVVSAALLALGLPFLHFRGTVPDQRALPAGVEARVVSEVLNSEFLPNMGSPVEVILTLPDDALSPKGIDALFAFDEELRKVAGFSKINGLFSLAPGLTKQQYLDTLEQLKTNPDPVISEIVATFAKGKMARFSLVSDYDYSDEKAVEQVAQIRALTPPPASTMSVGGLSAMLADLESVFAENVVKMIIFILSVMFVVLFIVFGSVTLPFKAMFMNALSLTASFGAIVWIFQEGRLEGVLHYQSYGLSDLHQPVVMFAIVFGLSMDYEVLLLARVREDYLVSNDNSLSVATGLAKTGRLITSAALLLIIVIGAFATSSIVFIKSLGLGMALAIGLDATIVRALLVPATMHLMGHWNWWAPKWLANWWHKAGLSDLEGGH